MFQVCGVTYVFTTNYGSCLQAYALQTAVEKQHLTEEAITPSYMLVPLSNCPGYPHAPVQGLKQKIKSFIKKRFIKYSRKPFRVFEKQYMKYAPVSPISQLKNLNQTVDAFVCGSDVIWNPIFNHDLDSFYLDFAEKYKFSYAASFGQSDIDPEKFAHIRELISRLDEISVRERGSAGIARQCTDKPVQITVDPVLLLNRDEWNHVAEKENNEGEYIFVYSVTKTGVLHDFVDKLSKQTGINKVIYSGGNPGAALRMGQLQVPTPQRWLQLIRDAKYIVTDSFHGTAFSYLFHKAFFTVAKGDPKAGFNVRMYDFLNDLELADRMLTVVPPSIDTSAIDYTHADSIMEEKVAFSKNYLKENLEAAYRQKVEAEAKK